MGWKDKFTFLTPTFITHKVAEQELHFYPISVKFVFELKMLGKPMAQALAVLFTNKDSDTGATTQSIENSKAGVKEIKTIVEPITVEIAVYRSNQKQEAFEALFDALTNQDNGMLLGRMLMDSLREMFDDKEREDRNRALELVKCMDLTTLRDMITGLVKANAKVLGPLEDMAAHFSKAFLSGLPKKEDEEPVAKIVPKDEVAQEITGQISQTQSQNLFSEESPGT